jgi:hypothetical protein
MMVDDCFPVVTIASLCGDLQIFFHKSVMLCPVKSPPQMVDKGVILVADEEFNGREHIRIAPFDCLQVYYTRI